MLRQGFAEGLPRQGVPRKSNFFSRGPSCSAFTHASDSLDGILQAHPGTPQRLHANEQPLVVEIRDNVFEPFPPLANHHVQRNFDIVVVNKGRPCGCRSGYGDVSRGQALLSRDHNEREFAVRFLDKCQEIVRVRSRCDPLDCSLAGSCLQYCNEGKGRG